MVLHNRMAFILQFTDRVCSTWMVDEDKSVKDFTEESPPRTMIRLKMIRGNNDRVFYMETAGKSERIMQLEVNSEKVEELQRRIVYELYDAKVVSIATDCRNFQDDR